MFPPFRFRILLLSAVTVGLAAVSAPAQTTDALLRFEVPGLDSAASGWSGGPPGTLSWDSAVVHSGSYAGKLRRTRNSEGTFSHFGLMLPREVAGSQIELRGWLKTADVEGAVGLWLRQDGSGEVLPFDNMRGRQISGTTEWAEYRVVLPLDDRTRSFAFGALLNGSGTAWVDDLQLFVDGEPMRYPQTFSSGSGARLDHEFDDGSGLGTQTLSTLQIENLALTARVWGFVKYHHPRGRGAR